MISFVESNCFIRYEQLKVVALVEGYIKNCCEEKKWEGQSFMNAHVMTYDISSSGLGSQ